MSFLSRDQILEADDLKTEDVDVPEWGGTVRIKMLTAAERDEFESSTVEVKNGQQKPNLVNLRARLVAKCVVDEHGAKMFSPSDIRKLGTKSSAAMQRVFNACSNLSGISESDMNELAEDFEEGPNESSTSD